MIKTPYIPLSSSLYKDKCIHTSRWHRFPAWWQLKLPVHRSDPSAACEWNVRLEWPADLCGNWTVRRLNPVCSLGSDTVAISVYNGRRDNWRYLMINRRITVWKKSHSVYIQFSPPTTCIGGGLEGQPGQPLDCAYCAVNEAVVCSRCLESWCLRQKLYALPKTGFSVFLREIGVVSGRASGIKCCSKSPIVMAWRNGR